MSDITKEMLEAELKRATKSNAEQLDRIDEKITLLGDRCANLAEALYCTGQIAVVHHTTILRLIRLLRELDKQNDWVEKCPNLYERLETIQSVAAQSLEEYNERLSAVEEAIQ